MEAIAEESTTPDVQKPASKEDIKSYAESMSRVSRPEGTSETRICQLSEHYFRVNYFSKEKKSQDSMISSKDIIGSKMIEVVETPNGLEIVDHTAGAAVGED